MGIAQIPQKVTSNVQEAAKGTLGQHWTRTLAAGSLIVGAALLVMGKRKAGLFITAAGTLTALLEDPDSVVSIWNSVPTYLQSGQEMLRGLEKFVEDLSTQGESLRALLAKSQP